MPTDHTPTSLHRMLALLDSFYEASEEDEPYAKMVMAAELFFFAQSGNRDLADDIPASLDELGSFKSHIRRIQRAMTEDTDVAPTPINPGARLANLWVHLDSSEVSGNEAAEALFETSLPCRFDVLRLDPNTGAELTKIIHDARRGDFVGAQIVPISLSHRDEVLVARCIRLDSYSINSDTDPRLQLTISYIHWNLSMLRFAETEFGLTSAEVDVLLGLLSGASQTQVADDLGKSRETVKVQAKAILRKFGARQMAEVNATALAYAYLGAPSTVKTLAAPALPGPVVSSSTMMEGSDGRKVQVFEYGAPDGRPVLFWHGLILGPFFTPYMINRFKDQGLRVIAISRPGFGRSAPPLKWSDYNDTVTKDTVCIADRLGLENMMFWVHQAGISFACRAAGTLQGRVLAAAMNGAGVPIKPYMLRKMNRTTRVAAATVVYAPQLLEMMLTVGFRTWRKSGPVPFYEEFFGRTGVEQETLRDPEFARLFELGFLHTSAQNPKAMVFDGKSAMMDWSAAYSYFDFPQHWMHGDRDQILDAGFVGDFLETQGQPPLILRPGFGSDLLYRDFDHVLNETTAFFATVNPAG